MLIIGKFINNFKEFYKDINSATLTGAIDVIIVRQPDGSYICSPFHVRFGKIGVLRSREKIVDIEINGIPVNIHMKLGESGEAFFVEEVKDEKEVPSYLATSPLPDVPDLEKEIKKLKLNLELNSKNGSSANHPLTTTRDLVLNNLTTTNTNSTAVSKPVDCDILPSSGQISEPSKLFQVGGSSVEDATNNTDSSEEYKSKRKKKKKMSNKKRNKNKQTELPAAKDKGKQVDLCAVDDDKPEDIFQMDDDFAEEEKEESSASTGALSRSVSLPVHSNLDDLFGKEWSRRKMSSTFTGEFHPFSDGDVTPQSSPITSRPPSPLSDTEYENQKIEAGTSPDADSPSWGWGQLPNVPRKLSNPNNQCALDGGSTSVEGRKNEETSAEAEKRSMLGGMLNFMRSTKKMRHMPESEGIYLSELNSDELDPEVAALYFPKFKSTTYPRACEVKDEDNESGKGPSLPHSPHTVDGGFSPPDSDSDERLTFEHFSKVKRDSFYCTYSDVAMSLCGGLQDLDRDLPEERFLHSQVTFDEFTENPSILQDPNLVIRIAGKYYNWSTAASMLASIIMFNRPLPDKAANQLISEYMPKKKKKTYSSWWSWRRSETENKEDSENSNPMALTEPSLVDATEPISEENSEQIQCDTATEASEVTVGAKTVDVDANAVAQVASEVQEKLEETLKEIVKLKIAEEAAEIQTVEVMATIQEAVEVVEALSVVIDSDKIVETKEEKEDSVIVTPPSAESSEYSSPMEISKPICPETDASNILSLDVVQAQDSAKLSPDSPEGNKPPSEKYIKSLRLTSEQIAKLNLEEGPNEFVFSVTTAYQGTTKCTCQVFLWNYDDKIVISDIDGTITRSDVLGHILPMVGHSWAQLGVAPLFTKIKNNGYKFLYLSARAIGQARITREYLRNIKQGDICLPDGPLLLSPTSLISALHREVIEKKPEEFKISCLKDIQTLFPSFMGNPFYAGFGNKINDTWAYRAVGIPLTRSFTINHKGEIKLELIHTFQTSYTRLSDDVDHIFSPLKPSMKVNGHPTPIFSSPEKFSYFTYWREPVLDMQEDDLDI